MTQTLTPGNASAVIKKYGGLEVNPVSSADRGMAIGIFGPGGVGKTTLAASITDSEHGGPALHINARGNPHVISSYGLDGRVQTTTISKFKDLEAIRLDIAKEGTNFPYKSVILDNVSEMFYLDLKDRYGPTSDVTWDKHSATTADVLQLVRNWMDLAEGGPKVNVVFVFQETPEKRKIRGTETERSELAFNKALQGQVPTIINFLGRLYIIEDTPPYRRLLDFRPVETVHQAKFQVDRNHPVAGNIPMEVYNPSLASLLDSVRYHKPWPTEQHLKKQTKET